VALGIIKGIANSSQICDASLASSFRVVRQPLNSAFNLRQMGRKGLLFSLGPVKSSLNSCSKHPFPRASNWHIFPKVMIMGGSYGTEKEFLPNVARNLNKFVVYEGNARGGRAPNRIVIQDTGHCDDLEITLLKDIGRKYFD
jgi:hypothetical protein